MARVAHDFPWRLRLTHPQRAEIVMERPGRRIVVDPHDAGGAGDIVVLTGPDAIRAIGEGEVVGSDAIVALVGRGHAFPATVDGVSFDGMTCELASDGVRGVFRRAVSRGAVAPHQIVQLTFPDGMRLLHLGLSLHEATDEAWVTRAAARFGNPDWILVGVPYGAGAALVRWLPRFGPNRVLVADLANDDRRERRLPTELVTPVRDALVGAGVDAHVFATQTSFRFE